MAKKALTKEVEEWLESDVETALIELKKVDEANCTADFCIGEDEQKFTITFPKTYPKSKEKFVISSGEDNLKDWVKQINKFADKSGTKLSSLLTQAADDYLELTGGDDEEEEGDEDNLLEDEDLGLETKVEIKAKTPKSKIDEEIDSKEFLEIGSASATMRLIKDLKNIYKGNPKDLGFSASPAKDPASGLENLYHWNVKLFGFEPKSDMAKDMAAFQKKTGQDHILIELRFSKDYPFAPPFVRVVSPRFAFRTGHVTMGGSICMELLTNSGWNSTNDIESILIQIRAEMLSGGARLDSGMDKNYAYSEHEAWDAFYRAAKTHGWNINNLGPEMFPKVKQ